MRITPLELFELTAASFIDLDLPEGMTTRQKEREAVWRNKRRESRKREEIQGEEKNSHAQ